VARLACTCLATFFGQAQAAGQERDVVASGLVVGGTEAGEDLPAPPSPVGLVAAGEIAGDDRRTYVYPLIERLRPEIVAGWEDMCYNHGMLISPGHFRRFCAPYYRRTAAVARDCGAEMFAVDCDGNVMELVGLLDECGLTAMYPFEVKAGNDLFELRRRHERFILMGWLEKECVNEGNERLIAPEILSKVPPLLEKGRYFPNGDHGLQPMATFRGMCMFMTLLHEVTGNPEGEFPRVRPE
jgi:hypothetical protein